MDFRSRLYLSAFAAASKRGKLSTGQLVISVEHFGGMTYEQCALHGTSDSIRDPACPIRPWSNSDTEDEKDTTRNLDSHCPEAESTDETSLIGFVDLGSVLQDSEECT
jgi:hypothetical protein